MSVRDARQTTNASPAESALKALVRLLARQAAREHLASADAANEAEKAGEFASRAEAGR